jgi:hypothetical protein
MGLERTLDSQVSNHIAEIKDKTMKNVTMKLPKFISQLTYDRTSNKALKKMKSCLLALPKKTVWRLKNNIDG